jgi:hypothetical protein
MVSRLLAAMVGTLGVLAASGRSVAQAPSRDPAIAGTWQLEKGKVSRDGPRTVVIRADSSANWGKEYVRWRLQGDRILIALGGEWEIYKIKVKGERLTLSGPDLPEEITLRRVGPPTPRPDSIPVPPAPEIPPDALRPA